MKNIFLFLSFALLMSCKSFDQEITAINELASNWDLTSEAATGFSNMLNDANADYSQKISSLSIDSTAFSKLPAEQQDKITGAKNGLMGVGNQLAQLTNDFGGFLDQWTEKSSLVNTLKESIGTKTFSATTLTDVADLSQFITDSNGKLDQFKQTLETVKSGIMSNHSDLTGLLASVVK